MIMKKLVLTTVCALAMTGAAFAQGFITYSPAANLIVTTNSASYSPLFGGGSNPNGGASGVTLSGSAASTLTYDYAFLYYTANVFNGSTPTIGLNFSSWQSTGIYATNSSVAGRIIETNQASTTFNVGGGANGGSSAAWANGTTNYMVEVGWSANLGGTWAVVSNELATFSQSQWSALLGNTNGFFGASVVGWLNPGSSSIGAPGVFGGGSPSAAGLPISDPASGGNGPVILYLIPTPEPGTMALAGLSGLSLLLFRRRKV